MKKLLILFMLVSINTFAQNLIGSSYKTVRESMLQQGYSINTKSVEGSTDFYLSATDNETIKLYMFESNNTCVAYSYFTSDGDPDIIDLALKKAGYYYYDNKYYSGNQIATIVYSKEIGWWGVRILTN